ncbi:MAG: SUMF1/EgtB/PvdO family nonheme iron enzyme [Pirellulaceae bacterium]|nr:SUMF1/EgtB/PvdO family nonheme iron enzyme [Pirellulaceae bacterium]
MGCEKVHLIRVFVSSPGDVAQERHAMEKILNTLNELDGQALGFRLEPFRWENCASGTGSSPQEVVDQQTPDCDIYVGIMSAHFGTPTGQYQSGTEKEYEDARRRNERSGSPWITFYFDDAPKDIRDEKHLEQYGKVLAFRRRVKSQGILFGYNGLQGSPTSFVELVTKDLRRIVHLVLERRGAVSPDGEVRGESSTTAQSGVPLETHVARLVSAYQEHINLRWNSRWADESANSRPPYIETQELSLLLQTDRPERFLHPEYFRVGRRSGSLRPEQDQGQWGSVDRVELAHNRLGNSDGSYCDLSRLVITTDAGVGKTTTMEWLEAELNEPGGATAAFCLPFSRLPVRLEELLPELARWMLQAEGVPCESASPGVAGQVLHSLRDQGRLVLLLDALDQEPPDGSAAQLIGQLLGNPAWRGCRIVISGRPHALERHWSQLFATELGYRWRFAKVEEFTADEQRRFLGTDDRGRDRLDLIPREACEILSTPRVLSYLRALPDSDLRKIRTAGDVYWLSIQHLLVAGMQGSDEARRINLDPAESTPAKLKARSKDRAQKVLAAMAFEMTSTQVTRLDAEADEPTTAPNFDGVPRKQFPRFRERLLRRLEPSGLSAGADQRLEHDLDSLAALNEFVSQGLFDTAVEGMQEVFWRNRTLQEFFTALWLAQYCRFEDTTQLWDWLYVPDRPETEEYYWVWRFVSEMPDAARDPESWLLAIEPIYRQGDGTVEGTRRSSEFIYRACAALGELVAQGNASALAIRRRFQGEFQSECLSGSRGSAAQEAAKQLCDSFIDVPAGEFRMGAPPEKQGMDEDLRFRWKAYLERDGDPEELARQHIASWSFTPGRRGKQEREYWLQWYTQLFRDKDVERFEQSQYPKDETPLEALQEVDAFRLSRCPTLNSWYRLFVPGHGEVESSYRELYASISPAADSPVIFVSWYDAWAFALWARWDVLGCRLPREYEWEYAAKAGTAWDQNYWWGDEFDPAKCNAENNEGRTTPPSASHANPWGFEDILGNVGEWCDEWYRKVYDRNATGEAGVRVFRGGSWAYDARRCRAADRLAFGPAYRGVYLGFRVAAVPLGGAGSKTEE